jgi:hypothetical protein
MLSLAPKAHMPRTASPPPEACLRKEESPAFAGLFLLDAFVSELLGGGHFFGFAFLAHHFELALGFFVGSLHFLLDADSRFF